jgi:predicted esterase
MRNLVILLAAVSLALSATAGTVTERIACASDATQTYSLFLPASYDSSRRYPVLLIFDPRGRALVAMERFQEAADARGWILISSYDTRSDGPIDPNVRAIDALWPEIGRYPIDPQRIYAAGFSGGGILAMMLGISTSKLAGVIQAGGRNSDMLALEKVNFAHFGAAGRFDFNFVEMKRLDRMLSERRTTHRFQSFDGGHEWLPVPLATRAVEWMDVIAMKRGHLARDAAFVERLLADELTVVAEYERDGRLLEAIDLATVITESWEGLADVGEARRKLSALRSDRRVAKLRKEELQAERYEESMLRNIGPAVSAIRDREMLPPQAEVESIVRLAELRRLAARAGAKGEAAQRVLESAFSQLSFYLTRDLMEQRSYARAALALTVACLIHDDRPFALLNLARARAMTGDRRGGLDALEKAVEHGLKGDLPGDALLEPLRKDPRFVALSEKARLP